MKRLLTDPLFHFILLGAALFGVWNYLHPGRADDDPNTIRVDRAALLEFIQLRMRAFDDADAQARLASFSPEALADVVSAYVREEALYRSAQALGLGADDYVIKQRLVQKMEYMAEGMAGEPAIPSDTVLCDFYQRHQEEYIEPAQISFTHVFFSASRHGEEKAAELAADALIELNLRHVPLTGATGFGERFPYQVNYVERTRDDVAGHFGPEMTDGLFKLEPNGGQWHGVYTSSFGKHLVLLTKSVSARVPEFTEVRSQVLQDFRAEQLREHKAGFIKRIIGEYRIDLDADLQPAAAP